MNNPGYYKIYKSRTINHNLVYPVFDGKANSFAPILSNLLKVEFYTKNGNVYKLWVNLIIEIVIYHAKWFCFILLNAIVI